MGKRSRDASFSPTAEASSFSTTADTSPDVDPELPPSKLLAGNHFSPLGKGAMQCSLPPHREPIIFATLTDFDVHYAKEHTNRCSKCGKNFPSAHFLTLHIEENHNAIRDALQARGEKTFGCFVDDCDRKCSTPQKRRLHLIDKHQFPKAYNFRTVDSGIDKSTTMLREGQRRRISTSTDPTQSSGHRRRTSSSVTPQIGPGKSQTKTTQAPEVDHTNEEVDELQKSMSALQFVPRQVMRK